MSTSHPSYQQDAPRALEAAEPALTAAPGRDLPGHGEVIRPADFSPSPGPRKPRHRAPRPVHWVLAGSFAVLALIAGFLFSARSVVIHVVPEDAAVAVDGGLHLPVGDSYLMLRGDYRLRISAPGYHPLERAVTVGEAQNQSHRFTLEKLPGHLTVAADIDETGQVWIDGEQWGALNQTISHIPAGEHALRIVTERYQPFETTLHITGLDRHQRLNVTLDPAWADVHLVTEPPGAELSVDGEAVGNTPLTADILAGEHNLALKLSGYKTWREVLEVSAGDTVQLPPVTLQKADGLVLVQSKPAGASITVNGDYHGLTPMEVALPPGDSYRITLFKDGFKPAQQAVAVQSGKEQTVTVNLQANLGQVSVSASPKDALLYVDGRLMGRANQTLSLPAHQTAIAVKKEGYADYNTTVLPRPDFDQSVEVKLRTLEEAKWDTIATAITTRAGQQLKLFRPDTGFTMGSSRREQGRRANEALRPVALTRPFYLGIHEVTNREFRRFQPEHSSGHVKGESLNGERYPVVDITWQQAALYCNWLSEQEDLPLFYQVEKGVVTGFNPQATGYRLPTETEWAWAARYRNGDMLKYAWGTQLPPSGKTANIADRTAAPLAGYVQPAYDDGHPASAPVGSFAANHNGLHDLGGNVAEWVNDFYDVAVGLSQQTDTDPLGPLEGSYHVIRGPSWAHGGMTELRLSFRDYGEDARKDVGFRIARFVE